METKEGDSREASVKAPTDDAMNSDTQQSESSKSKRRLTCTRCHRPTPRACICEGLPEKLIALEETELVILQHPHELRQKNRSVPILELCLEKKNFHLCIGRRLGYETDPNILSLLQPPNIPILLYPEESNSDVQVLSLTQAKVRLQQRKEEMKLKQERSGKIVVFCLDATWKYAREMHLANQKDDHYPSHMLQVSLQAEDFPESFRPQRFDIRTTPGDNKNLLSTAECIAWVLSQLESKPDLFSTIMRPLDEMVKKWNSFVKNPKVRDQPRKKQKR